MGIKQKLKEIMIGLTPGVLRRAIEMPHKAKLRSREQMDRYINLSFSQEGEDLVLYRLMGHKTSGFYVDIGAHHPFRFSNTYKFYLMGWKGINLDPLPGSMELFNEKRPNDINLELPVLNSSNTFLTYYMFQEPALNTFDEATALEREKISPTDKIINRLSVKAYKLAEILDMHLPPGQKIDFFSIDVEGMDMEVIQSNDWSKYRPLYIVIESLLTHLEDDLKSPVSAYLNALQYKLIAKTANSLIYKNEEAL